MRDYKNPHWMFGEEEQISTLCQCKKCGKVFKYEDCLIDTGQFGTIEKRCPVCKGFFTIIHMKHAADENYVNKFINYNPNNDIRCYKYE